LPPFAPPSLPSATAAGILAGVRIVQRFARQLLADGLLDHATRNDGKIVRGAFSFSV
jgi:hypothetical protein